MDQRNGERKGQDRRGTERKTQGEGESEGKPGPTGNPHLPRPKSRWMGHGRRTGGCLHLLTTRSGPADTVVCTLLCEPRMATRTRRPKDDRRLPFATLPSDRE